MATKKRSKGARPAGRRGKRPVRGQAVKRGKARSSSGRRTKKTAVARKKSVARVRKIGASKGAKRAKTRQTKASTAARGGTGRELATLKREKSQLEKRLTDMVREIGQLRYHETRASQLERQVAERDQTIGTLRSEIAELRNRRADPHRDDAEVQHPLALGSGPTHEFDEFDEESNLDDDEDDLI